MEKLLAVVLSGALNGMIYGLVGLGYALVYRASGLVNLAHGEFVMAGALVAHWLIVDQGVPLVVSMMLVMLVGSILGAGTEFMLLRRMRQPDLLKGLIITFGLVLVLQAVARELFGTQIYSLPTFPGVPTSFSVVYDRAVLPGQAVWIAVVGVSICAGTVLVLSRTRLGSHIRAVGSDPQVAAAYGIPSRRVVMTTFALSGALAALSGLLIAPVIFMTYLGGTMLGLKGLVAAIAGGLRRPEGALAGGLLLGVAETLTAGYLAAGWQNVAAFVLLIAVLLARPHGLLLVRQT